MEKKYELVNPIEYKGKTLYQIKALKELQGVEVGDLGGYIENEKNLSHEGSCWLYGTRVIVMGDSKVTDDCIIDGNSIIDDSILIGSVTVFDSNVMNSKLIGNVNVRCDSSIGGSMLQGDVEIDNSDVSGSDIYSESTVKHILISGGNKILESNIYAYGNSMISIGDFSTILNSNISIFNTNCFIENNASILHGSNISMIDSNLSLNESVLKTVGIISDCGCVDICTDVYISNSKLVCSKGDVMEFNTNVSITDTLAEGKFSISRNSFVANSILYGAMDDGESLYGVVIKDETQSIGMIKESKEENKKEEV